ncbi:hypothetical protein AKJ16_DCAP14752, partial [Drosera capensis]
TRLQPPASGAVVDAAAADGLRAWIAVGDDQKSMDMQYEDIPEALTVDVVALFMFEGECFSVQIRSSTTLVNVFEQLMNKCQHINPTMVVVRYFAPQIRSYVTLTTDDAVTNMCMSGVDRSPSAVMTPILENNLIELWRDCIQGIGQLKRNTSEKIAVSWTHENYKWRVYASKSKRDPEFAIRKCDLTYTCEIGLADRGHPKAKSIWVSNLVKRKL